MKLTLKNISAAPSNKLLCSVPLGPEYTAVTVPGALKTQTVALGRYPWRALQNPAVTAGFAPAGADPLNLPPRRALLFAEFAAAVPETVEIELLPGEKPAVVAPKLPPGVVRFDTSGEIYRKREHYAHLVPKPYHYVKREDRLFIQASGREYELVLGWIMADGERRRFQWGAVIPEWTGELSCAFTAGGHIYAGAVDRGMTMEEAGNVSETDFLRERTIAVRAFVTVESDGHIGAAVHYANVQGYGAGDDAFGVPLVELRTAGELPEITTDITPFKLTCEPGVWRCQPLGDAKIFQKQGQRGMGHYSGGVEHIYVDRSENAFVKGVGYSFNVDILPPGSAKSARFIAPGWWHNRCSLFGRQLPEENLHTFTHLEKMAQLGAAVFKRNTDSEPMTYGGVYRLLNQKPDGRYEFSNDGNEAAFLWRGAYMREDGELYRVAAAAARYIADVAVEHYYFNVHYHSDDAGWQTFSLIYLRFAGMLYNYLETGDRCYLELSRAVADRWIAVNRQNQPRANMGRDAEPVEGLLLLYDLCGDDHYFQAAVEIAGDVQRTLDENFFWRSGFGVGPWWGVNGLFGTAWNGAHLLAGLAELLIRATPELCPDYAGLLKSALGMARRILQSVREDFGGVHRSSGGFLRRLALLAEIAGDRELAELVAVHIRALSGNYDETGERFFDNGHHCAGYVEQDHVINRLKVFAALERGSK